MIFLELNRARYLTSMLLLAMIVTACGTTSSAGSQMSEATDPTENRQVEATVATSMCLPPNTNTPEQGLTFINVYFPCQHDTYREALYPLPRTISESATIQEKLQLAVEALLAGPTAEEQAAGFTSWFSSTTANALNEITLDEDGTVQVDLANLTTIIPNASTTAVSGEIVKSFEATLFQFESVERIIYVFDGDCAATEEFFQSVGCQQSTREEWQNRQQMNKD